MKKYNKPEIFKNDLSFEDILIVSTTDETFDLDEEGVFDEVWN